MSIIKISNMSFNYLRDSYKLFENISLNLDTDWRLGLIGRNGRGKTTLLKILNGELQFDGKIDMCERTQYFPKLVKNMDLDAIDVIYELYPDVELWKLLREMSLLKIEDEVLYRPFSTLSGGEQSKIQLAALFSHDNEFLLLDEVTNHLDAHGREMVAEYISSKSGFILVSHDRDFLDKSVNHILSINRNSIDLLKGNYTVWEEQKALDDNFEIEKNRKLKTEIKKLTEASRRFSNWSDQVEKTKFGNGPVDRGFIGTKSAKMMKKSINAKKKAEEAIEEKSSLLKDIEIADELTIMPLAHGAKNLFKLHDFQVCYNNPIFEKLNLDFANGDILSINGDNGSGKSSLIKALLGEDIPYLGHYNMANEIIISYLPQDFSHLSGSIDEFIFNQGIDKTVFFTILRKLDFPREQFIKDMKYYSSGQKKKVLMAASIAKPAHLYFWDEPLNFIDVFTRIQIENMILEYSPSMVIIEHDKRFVESVSTKTIELKSL
ncbi:MAG: ABC-F family ATP-binding cassette domain-containing protein [Tissierellia bacterium]|nr:ABC-F family ATP-binding cassette domain-containing protein [Tissierellia bacterium]